MNQWVSGSMVNMSISQRVNRSKWEWVNWQLSVALVAPPYFSLWGYSPFFYDAEVVQTMNVVEGTLIKCLVECGLQLGWEQGLHPCRIFGRSKNKWINYNNKLMKENVRKITYWLMKVLLKRRSHLVLPCRFGFNSHAPLMHSHASLMHSSCTPMHPSCTPQALFMHSLRNWEWNFLKINCHNKNIQNI